MDESKGSRPDLATQLLRLTLGPDVLSDGVKALFIRRDHSTLRLVDNTPNERRYAVETVAPDGSLVYRRWRHGDRGFRVQLISQAETTIKFDVELLNGTSVAAAFYHFYYRPHGQQLLFRTESPSQRSIRIYKLEGNTAQTYALTGAGIIVELPPGTYMMDLGVDKFLLRILDSTQPSCLDMLPMASHAAANADGLHNYGLASSTSPEANSTKTSSPCMSVEEWTDSRVLTVARTPSSESYNVTRLATIGFNSNTLVVKVKHSRQHGETALKIPHPKRHSKMSPAELIRASRAWLNEYSIHNQLMRQGSPSKHHIVQLFDGDARLLSLHMEIATCGSLADCVDDGISAGSRELAAFVMINIAAGLEYCHNQNIVHNDVKPENIFMHETKGPQLGDLGCATRGPSTCAGGTGLYVPPEYQLRGLRGAPGDIWALGVTMLFALQVTRRIEPRFAFNFHLARGRNADATGAMKLWIEHVTRGRDEALPLRGSWMVNPVQAMLDHNPATRPSASVLLRDTLRRQSEATASISSPSTSRIGATAPRPYHQTRYLLLTEGRATTQLSYADSPPGRSPITSTQHKEWKQLMDEHKTSAKKAHVCVVPDQGARGAQRRNEGRHGLPQHPFHADCGCHACVDFECFDNPWAHRWDTPPPALEDYVKQKAAAAGR